LHVTVLNTVVDHLDVVTGTLVTDPVTARLAVALGSDALEDILDVGPGLLVTTGHEGGTVTGTLLTTGDTRTDETDTLGGEVLSAAVGVGEVRVTTVDDDISLFKVWKDGLDEVIDGLTGHDKEHNATGLLQLGAELLDGVSTDDGLACVMLASNIYFVFGFTYPWLRWQGSGRPWKEYGCKQQR
jgi:hypothetical protein